MAQQRLSFDTSFCFQIIQTVLQRGAKHTVQYDYLRLKTLSRAAVERAHLSFVPTMNYEIMNKK